MKPISEMTPITGEEIQNDFDAILDRVEAGECFIIDPGTPNAVVLIPYNEETTALLTQIYGEADQAVSVPPPP